jgi:hypothetical protein
MGIKMRMQFIIGVLIVLSSFAIADEQGAATQNKTDSVVTRYSGKWKIVKYEWGSVSAMSKEEAQKGIGRRIVLGKDSLQFGSVSCVKPVYRESEEDALDYLKYEYRTTPQKLGIKQKKIMTLEVNCGEEADTPSYPYVFFLISKNKIIMAMKGVFFYLERVKS